jgi:outer membrane protein OmpA-like peptidoglycan-associated protein
MMRLFFCLTAIVLGTSLLAQNSFEIQNPAADSTLKKNISISDMQFSQNKIYRDTLFKYESNDSLPEFPFCNWSFGLSGGVSYCRATSDFKTSTGNTINFISSPINPTGYICGFVEYNINPILGIGLDATYTDYSRTYASTSGVNYNDFSGNIGEVGLYGSINFTKIVSPYKVGIWRIFNLYGMAGIGAGFYQHLYPTETLYTGQGSTLASKIGLTLECNISKLFAVSLGTQYHMYDQGDLGGVTTPTNHTDGFTFQLGIRYKMIDKRHKHHLRNVFVNEYIGDQRQEDIKFIDKAMYNKIAQMIKENEEQKAETARRLKSIENDNLVVRQKLDSLAQTLKTLADRPGEQKVNASFDNLEFESNSDKLAITSFATLDQIAVILNDNPIWNKVTITGHTDATGSIQFNQRLSEARANSVKEYLQYKKVNAQIVTVGFGATRPIAPNNTPEGRKKNRRVAFEITK